MKVRKNKKWVRAVVLILLAVVVVCILAVVSYLTAKYHSAYEPIDVVERPDSYELPEYPGLDEQPPDTELPETSAPPVTETEPDSGESTPPESDETVSPGTEEPVTEPPETLPPETTAAVTEPPETVPSIVTHPAVTEEVRPADTTRPADTAKPADTTKPAAVTTNKKPKKPGKWSVYIKDPIYKVDQIDSDIINILLLGIDTRDVDLDKGRSDSMIALSYNKKTGAVRLLSFLRDSLVPIEGHDWNRLNTAYTFGGAGMAVNTFNQLWGLDIQHYVAIDLSGIKTILELIGPLELNLTQAEVDLYRLYGNTRLKVGVNTMSTSEIYMHISNRTSDSDFGRTRRQRDVVIAIAQKLLKEKSLGEILAVVEQTAGIVNTNIEMSSLISLASSIVSQKDTLSIETHNVPFSDAYTFAWYKKMAILSFDIRDAAQRVQKILYGDG